MSLLEHRRRRDRVREIAALDVEHDYQRIYQLTSLYEFPADTRLGLNLAFYRTFSTPRIAELLARTGEMKSRPAKRSYDTGIVMYELIVNGFDHPRGHQMVDLLNKVHRRWSIADEDYLYVLTTFIVVPTRWIERHGWRPILDKEREAAHRFYQHLGSLMNIPDIPPNYAEAERVFDTYEAKNLEPSSSGTTLMQATTRVFADRLPRPTRRLAPTTVSSLINDPILSSALGLPAPRALLVRAVDSLLRLRNWRERLTAPRATPWFTPGQPAGQVYKKGYQLDEIGPASTTAS